MISKTLRVRMLFAAMLAVVGSVLGWVAVGHGSSTAPMPADKMTVDESKIAEASPNNTGGTNTVTLLSAQMRTSTTEDLVLQVTAECSLVTDVTTHGTDDQSSQGTANVWVEIDHNKVPVATDSSGKVTFCNRAYERKVNDGDSPAAPGSLIGDDTIQTFFSTKDTHGFNWVALNVGNGIHLIEVKAELTATATNTADHAKAVIGNRSLVIDPTHAAPNATLCDTSPCS
jgi:hypothetical protein